MPLHVLSVNIITCSLFLLATASFGQTFPNKPIRIVTCGPGGTCDLAARLVAQGLAEIGGQQVFVDNRGAANGLVAAQTVVKAPPDGYTLLFHSSPIWLLPFLQDDVPYDPLRDFVPVTLAVSAPNVLVVHPSLPVKSVKDLIALAKARPGELNYGSGAAGASPHLAAELFKSMAGVNIVRIGYRGTGPAVIDTIAGRVQIMFPVVGQIGPHVQAGKLKALAIGSAQPSALFPGLPTVAASGLPGYESVGMFGLFATAGTPDAIVDQLNRQTVTALNRADLKKRFADTGVEVVASTREHFGAKVKNEMALLGKVIKEGGIRAE